MNTELDELAKLLSYYIEKYVNEIELESLPDPPRPTTD